MNLLPVGAAREEAAAYLPDIAVEDENLLGSICQFDLLGCIMVVGAHPSTEGRYFYPSFAWYDSKMGRPLTGFSPLALVVLEQLPVNCGGVMSYELSQAELLAMKQNQRDAAKALNLAYWSYTGLAIPLLGWVLGALSLQTINQLPRDERRSPKVQTAKRNAVIAVLLSVAMGIFWGTISYQSSQRAKQAQAEQEAQKANEQHQQQLQEINKAGARAALTYCLNQADNWYSENLKTASTIFQQQALDNEKQQQIQECQVRYPTAN